MFNGLGCAGARHWSQSWYTGHTHTHTSPFNVFILGMPKSRWKLVQISGRLGRKLGEKAIFITVVPEKQVVRGVLNIHCEQCCCNGIFFLLTK